MLFDVFDECLYGVGKGGGSIAKFALNSTGIMRCFGSFFIYAEVLALEQGAKVHSGIEWEALLPFESCFYGTANIAFGESFYVFAL